MKKYENLCEMDIGDLMNSLVGSGEEQSCDIQQPVQPDDDIGKFGNENDIQIKVTPEGGLEVDSKEMAIKISSTIYDAIKAFIQKEGE